MPSYSLKGYQIKQKWENELILNSASTTFDIMFSLEHNEYLRVGRLLEHRYSLFCYQNSV